MRLVLERVPCMNQSNVSEGGWRSELSRQKCLPIVQPVLQLRLNAQSSLRSVYA